MFCVSWSHWMWCQGKAHRSMCNTLHYEQLELQGCPIQQTYRTLSSPHQSLPQIFHFLHQYGASQPAMKWVCVQKRVTNKFLISIYWHLRWALTWSNPSLTQVLFDPTRRDFFDAIKRFLGKFFPKPNQRWLTQPDSTQATKNWPNSGQVFWPWPITTWLYLGSLNAVFVLKV